MAKIKILTENELKTTPGTTPSDLNVLSEKYSEGAYAKKNQIDSLVNCYFGEKPLSNMKQLLYRNFEGDNRLPTAEFSGRVRPIQTPIILVSSSGPVYVVKNMPNIPDIKTNPTNWLMWSINFNSQPDDAAVKVLSAVYLGTVGADKNCCQLTLNKTISASNGNYMAVMSFKAYGITIQPTPSIPKSTGAWNLTYTSALGAGWKHSDGSYRVLACGYNKTVLNRVTHKLFRAETWLSPTWTVMTNYTNVDDFASVIPAPYIGLNPLLGISKMSGMEKTYFSAAGLINSNGTLTNIAVVVFDEDLTYKRVVPITVSYSYQLTMTGYVSATYFKGKYLVVTQDGNHITGKRIVLQSDNIEGPYTLASVIFDFGVIPGMLSVGSPFSGSVANGIIFVYNDSLYYISSGQSTDTLSGNLNNHEQYLWKFNEANSTWNCIVSPMMMAMHGDSTNYPELGSIAWARDHVGVFVPHFIEDGNLNFGMAFSGGTDSYQCTTGNIDLSKMLD